MLFIYNIPLFLLFILILVTCVSLSLAGLWLVRRNGWMLHADDNGTAGLAHSFVGVLYAVALGLMVVGVQSSYSEVETVVMKEAYLAGDLYIDAEGLSGQDSIEVQRLAKAYVDSVILKEWPAIAAGNVMEQETQTIINDLLHHITTHEPSSDRGMVIYSEVLSSVNDLLDQRRERLFLGSNGVGSVTWLIVLMGALITVGMAWFYNTKSVRAHYGLVACMSVMFSLMIFQIVAMDHPLWGQFSVSSAPFKEVQMEMTQWEKRFVSHEDMVKIP